MHIKANIGPFLIVVTTLFAPLCKAQVNNDLRNSKSVFIELFGNSVSLYSLNYDQVFYHRQRKAWSWRLGFGALPDVPGIKGVGLNISLLAELNYLYGKPPHFLELGTGLCYWQAFHIRNDLNWALNLRLGYRHQLPGGGFYFRIAFVPEITLAWRLDHYVDLCGGISLGYTFKPRKSTKDLKPAGKDRGVWGH